LADARRAVWICCVATFGHGVVIRLIAPVETVIIFDGRDDLLLSFGVGRILAQLSRSRLFALRLVLVDRGDVEDRQEVYVRESALRERAQVAHAVRRLIREG